MHKQPILFAAFALATASAGTSHAGGFAVARYAGEHGHVATDNPTAIYFNPAGLALGTGWRIYAEGLFALRHVTYERPEGAISSIVEPGETGVGTPREAVGANAGTAELNNFVVSPFLGVATDLGVPNLGLGLALHVPFGGQASWDKNEEWIGNTEYPGAEDGVQRWSTIEGSLRSLYVSLAGAYRLPGPRVSLGAGVNIVRSSIQTVRARTAAGTDDLVDASGTALEGRSLIDTSGLHLAASAGVIWEPVDRVWIGASYQSQPGFGTASQSGTLTNKLGPSGTSVGNIDLEQALPDIVRLGVRARVSDQVELRLSGDYQRWSVFQHQCLVDADDTMSNCDLDEFGNAGPDAAGIIVNIPRRWRDTFGVRAGGSYWITPAFELNGGANFDTSAVPDETIDASLLDQNKLIVLLGARFAVSEKLLLAASLNNVFYFDRTVEPRQPGDIGTVPPSTVPDGAGSYSQNVLYLNAGAEVRF